MPTPPAPQGPNRLRPSRTSPKPSATARGGYRKLRAFQTTTVIYDGTVAFCEQFIRSQHSRIPRVPSMNRLPTLWPIDRQEK